VSVRRLVWPALCVAAGLITAAGLPAAWAQEGPGGSPTKASPAAHAPAEPASGHGAAGAEAAGAEETPNILTGDLGNVFWTLVIFLTLLVVLRATAWKPILAALAQREKFISESLEKAKQEREKADAAFKEYTAKIEHARIEATAIVEEGKRDAEAVRRRIHEDAQKEATDLIARAKREIGVARDNAVKELYERTLDLATEVAGKIVRRDMTAQDHRALLDEALVEMSKTRN
jgi:F-type H+-transporting ATPase subunit b